jgi:propionyl-CoA carboxylase beta chain
MLFAYASATVPKITVIMRKAYGGAYLAMCSADMGADAGLCLADGRDRGDGRGRRGEDSLQTRNRRAADPKKEEAARR